jgi:hypothetical protein
MSSVSADELEGGMVKINDWQIVKNSKRRKVNTSQVDIPNTKVRINNEYNPLSMVESDSQTDPGRRTPKPHPHLYMGQFTITKWLISREKLLRKSNNLQVVWQTRL